MASVSLSLTLGQIEIENDPESIAVGSSAPGAGVIEIRVDMAQITSLKQIYLAMEAFDDFVRDQNYGPSNFKVL